MSRPAPLKREDSFKIVFPDLHYSKDWNISNGASLWTIFIVNNIAETLIRVGNNSDLTPSIASGWSYSEDRKILKLKISDQFFFHSGDRITTEDIVTSLKRSFSSPAMKHSEILKSLYNENVDEAILQTGQNVIEIKLKSPLNAFIYKLSIPEVGIAPNNYGKMSDYHGDLKNLSGPYKVFNFDKKIMNLKAHSKHPYINAQSPQNVDLVEISDTNNAIDYYQKHNNVMIIGSTYPKILKLIDLEGDQYISAFALTEFLIPNIDSPKLNSLKKRRRIFSAIKNAFDTINLDERITNKTNQLFTPSNMARLDHSKTDSLYNAPPNVNTKLNLALLEFVKESPIPGLLKERLKEYSIDLNIDYISADRAASVIKNKSYDLAYLYSGVSALDPIVELIYLFKHPFSQFSYKNEKLNDLLEKAKSETNREKYISLLKEIHFGLIKNYRILPLFHTRMIYTAKGDYKLKEMSHFDGGFNLWDWQKK